MDCKVVIPSRKRAETVLTKIDNAILCVHKSEKEKYKEHNNAEIITHDLSSLSEIRQFIYNKLGDVFMVDDDIVSVERLYCTENDKLTSTEIFNLIQTTYQRAKSINAFIFGFNTSPVKKHYKQHKPFMMKGYINGSSIGMIKNQNLFFDKNTTAAESHWINLLNAYFNRFLFIDMRFHFRQKTNSTFVLEGGKPEEELYKPKNLIRYI